MDIGLITLGVVFVLAALADVFLTVLYSRIGVGLLTPRLYRATWAVFRAAGVRMGRHRDLSMSFAGPIMMVLTAGMWSVLLLLGFALIAWPALGQALQASDGPTPTDFWTAMYYAGYSLTTLGTGDIVPKTGPYRLMMVFQALAGFSVITLTLTYFMSVYSALVRRNTLAQALHHLSGGTGDPVQLLVHFGPSQALQGIQGELTSLGFRVLDLLESHHAYPVLHYFRMREPRYAMARIAVLVLQPLTLVQSVLDDEHRELASSAPVRMLWGSGIDLLHQTAESLLGSSRGNPSDVCDRTQFETILERLQHAGIHVVSDHSAAAQAYHDRRSHWVGLARSFAALMAYRWDEMEVRHDAHRHD